MGENPSVPGYAQRIFGKKKERPDLGERALSIRLPAWEQLEQSV
jgi:hypothetical protein